MRSTPYYTTQSLAIAAVVGWLTWPYLRSAASSTGAKLKVAPIEAALLSPSLVPRPARDPFPLAEEVAEPRKAVPTPATGKNAAKVAGTAKPGAAANPNRLRSFWAELAGRWEKKSKELVSHARAA